MKRDLTIIQEGMPPVTVKPGGTFTFERAFDDKTRNPQLDLAIHGYFRVSAVWDGKVLKVVS